MNAFKRKNKITKEKYFSKLISIDNFTNILIKTLETISQCLLNARKNTSDSLSIFEEKLNNDKIQYDIIKFIIELLQNNFDTILGVMNDFSVITINMKEKIKNAQIKFIDYNNLSNEITEKYESLLKSKEEFYSIAEKAEKETLNSIKLTIKDGFEQNDNWKNLLRETKEKYNEYKNILNNINKTIINANKTKNILINSYNEITKEYNNLFINYLNIIIEKQKNINKIDETFKNIINNSKKIKYEYYNKSSYQKPFEAIPFEQYHTKLNFDECEDDLSYSVYSATIGTLENYIDEYVTKTEKINEEYKLEAKNNLKQLLKINSFNIENQKQILNYINNPNTHKIFLSLLTKLRVNNGFEKSELLIKTIGLCLNKILEEAEKKNYFDTAEECIVLSQTFYYKDKNSGNKIYIIEYLKKNKWITSPQFWRKKTDILYIEESEKIKKNSVVKWEILDNNVKIKKKGSILFSQITSSVQNMLSLKIEVKVILKVVSNILQKYNYLNENDKNSIYNIIGVDKFNIDKIINEINARGDINENKENDRNSIEINEKNNSNENIENSLNSIKINEKKESKNIDIGINENL